VRRNPPGEHPKYRYPSGVKAHEQLFNYSPELRHTVVLCEGAPDVIALWEVGVDAFGIYGSTLGMRQIELIARTAPSQIVLAFDNDRAGQQCTEAAEEVLFAAGFLTYRFAWRHFPHAKDVAELLPYQRLIGFANAKSNTDLT
jgi:DNA primase